MTRPTTDELPLAGAKVLVTGADGFIGSHLTEALVRAGAEVRAFVFYNPQNAWGWLDHCAKDVKGNFEVFAGDVRDPDGVRAALKGRELVAHLAALIAIPYSYHSPSAYVDTNVKGTLHVLQAARELGTRRILVTSTSEVYGTAQRVPMDETHPLIGQSPYSASKIGADQMALAFHRSFATPVVLLRPFNTYGPRQSARAIIPTIATQLLTAAGGRRALRLGATHPTRDFSYVADIVEGFMAALGCEAAVGQVINIGSGFETSIREVAEAIASIVGVELDIATAAERVRPAASEVDRLLADTALALRLFSWRPRHAGREGFRRGLEQTIAWLREPGNLAHYKPEIYNI
jgi:NAD dependent epimerase/dehydratase